MATSLSAAPGLYAVLVGSGLSSSAGILTGWQVVEDLIRQIARAESVDLNDLGLAPAEWWDNTPGFEPRYDVLLDSLAPTDLSRRALLARYFDPPAADGSPLQPTAAHTALAQLCAEGRIRVILTTNFDQLTERALDQVGVSAQVIRRAEVITGMIPIQHAAVTVVKLHGDYTEPGMRNSPDELRKYPDALRDLVVRIVDEYGLLVIGWSAEWDVALRNAIEEGTSRRYPTYWATYRGAIAPEARRLITWRDAIEIPSAGADELVTDLLARVRQLDFRAVQRARPRVLRTIWQAPSDSSAPVGWDLLPLLLLTATTGLDAAIDDCGYIREPERAAILDALARSPLTGRLYGLAGETPQLATPLIAPEPDDARPVPLGQWHVIGGDHQTTGHASYRIGDDPTRGTSCRLTISLPSQGNGGMVRIAAEVGVSIQRRLALHEVALIWRDALTLVTTSVVQAIAGILPAQADPSIVSIYAVAAATDGQQHPRENTLPDRVSLRELGPVPEWVPARLGLASWVAGGLTEHDAATLVAESLSIVAYDAGFVAPEAALRMLRHTLGL